MAGAGLAGCSATRCGSTAADGPRPPPETAPDGWRDEAFNASDVLPDGGLATIFQPDGAKDWPVVVALHGRGEAGRGLDAGAHGWRDDYDMERVRARLVAGPLTAEDGKGFVKPDRLRELNASLARDPFRGLVIACPYTPAPQDRSLREAKPFGDFVTKELRGRIEARRGAPIARAAFGIDGVSMGGRYALQLGFALGGAFGAVGALQPAISVEEAGPLADLAEIARKQGPQRIRLASSTEDPFLEPTRALSDELTSRGIDHQLIVADGPHDYVWNRGPGSIELLMFHERVLRGLPAP